MDCIGSLSRRPNERQLAERCGRLMPTTSATAAHRPSRGNEVERNSSFLGSTAQDTASRSNSFSMALLPSSRCSSRTCASSARSSGRRPYFLASCRGGQRTLCHQPPPGEDLIATDAVPAGDEQNAHARQIRLLNDPDLFLRYPPPPARNTGKNLASVLMPGRTVSHMPQSYLRAGSCQVI